MFRRTNLSVAALAAAALLLESALTRLLAVAQYYHFAFLVVSLALLGFGPTVPSSVYASRWRPVSTSNAQPTACPKCGRYKPGQPRCATCKGSSSRLRSNASRTGSSVSRTDSALPQPG
jgi:hypothetical protein